MRPLFLLLPLLFLPNRDGYGAAGPTCEVASIKLDTSNPSFVYLNGPPDFATLTATNVTLQNLITCAYKVKRFQIEGGPAWLRSDRFEVAAKPPGGPVTLELSRIMLRALLEDRFHLVTRRETREAPIYALTPAKSGLKIKPASEACGPPRSDTPRAAPPPPGTPPVCGNYSMGTNSFEGRSVSMTMLLRGLTNILGRTVIDKTGYSGTFDIHVEFSPEGAPLEALPDNPSPTIFTALREQPGLKLESQKGPADLLVIDHAEKPSEN